MPTIRKRISTKGDVSYYAEVRVHEGKTLVARKSATFPTQREAKAWATRTEAFLQDPANRAGGTGDLSVGDLIRRYTERMSELAPIRRTRAEVLRRMLGEPLAQVPLSQFSSTSLVDYCEGRRHQGAGPATTLVDFTTLTAVFRDGGRLLGLPVDDRVFRESRPLLMRLGLVGKGASRKRRPSSNELDRILAAMRMRESRAGTLIPMVDLVEFLVYSCMRLGEMCGLLWEDVDEGGRTVVVRNRKHPTEKATNHQTVALLGPAWTILQRQARLGPRIFPYDPGSVSAAFQRVRDQCGIQDLRLHDLRREGISRLLEMGFAPHEVMAVSGHRSPAVFHQHYTSITPGHLHRKYDHVPESD